VRKSILTSRVNIKAVPARAKKSTSKKVSTTKKGAN
jgi:hypothetical protein